MRQIHIDNGAPGQPEQPQLPNVPVGMEELITSAEQDWKFKRKDEAFVKVLGALAMISQGVAQSMKYTDAALKIVRASCSHDFVESNGSDIKHCRKCWELKKPDPK